MFRDAYETVLKGWMKTVHKKDAEDDSIDEFIMWRDQTIFGILVLTQITN